MPSVTSLKLVYEAPPHPIESKDDTSTDNDDAGDKKKDDAGEKDTVSAEDTAAAKDGDGDVEGASEKGEASEAAADDDEKKEDADDDDEKLAKAVLKAKLKHLADIGTGSKSAERYAALSSSLLAENPKHLPLLLEVLSHARKVDAPEEISADTVNSWRSEKVVAAAERFIAPAGPIDTNAVAQYFGCNRELPDDATKAEKDHKKDMEDQRAALRLSLLAKAYALSALVPFDNGSSCPEGKAVDDFCAAVLEMKRWVSSESAVKDDADKDAFALTLARYEVCRAKPGAALALLRKRMGKHHAESARAKDVAKECIGMYRRVGVECWAVNLEEALYNLFPVGKRPL
jgi:hypothetical protein